jgi:hypothetical protein
VFRVPCWTSLLRIPVVLVCVLQHADSSVLERVSDLVHVEVLLVYGREVRFVLSAAQSELACHLQELDGALLLASVNACVVQNWLSLVRITSS